MHPGRDVLLAAVSRVSGAVMWANLHLLFWLSLVPLSTAWMSEHRFPPIPTAVHGIVLLAASIGYLILQTTLLRVDEEDSGLAVPRLRCQGQDLNARVLPRDRPGVR